MKNICMGFLLACVLLMGVAATREGLYRRFGPVQVEAIVLLVVDQLNTLRQNPTTTYPEITGQQIMDALDAKMNTLQPYDWMNE